MAEQMIGTSRGEYEEAIKAMGLEPETDERIWRCGYALENGDFPVGSKLNWQIATRPRYRRLYAEAKARAQAKAAAAQPITPMGTCEHCGRQVASTTLMTASQGTVCPDCYDDASE